MAKVYLEDSELTNIGNAIRNKNGTTTKYLPSEMPAAISAIETGGGGDISTFLKMPNRCEYLFCYDRFKNTYQPYKDEIDWSSARYIDYLFQQSSSDWTDWTIEVSNAKAWYPFSNAKGIKYPHLKVLSFETNGAMEFFGNSCGNNREDDATCHNVELAPITPGRTSRGFMYGSGLRFVPNSFYTFVSHNETYTGTQSYSTQTNPYRYTFYSSRCVEEILNVPLWTNATITIQDMVGNNQRLRRFTFETKPDGTPYSCPNWTVTLRFTGNYGYGVSTSGTGYGKGFSSACVISTDEQYAERKNLPDRCPQTAEYSDYNHTSAVETINSLPIVKSGTITFEGAQGSKTAGGAISNLTEAEIAVATAKGWTVTIS